MLDMFPVIRFSQFVAIVLAVGLVTSSGCRILSPKGPATQSPALTPVQPMQQPVMNTPDQYSAFRPVLPDEYIPPFPVQEIVQEPQKIEPVPSIEQSKLDELYRVIADLEAQLEEARNTPVLDNVLEPLLTDEPPAETTEFKVMKSLPIINQQGVNVSTDESKNVRIEVADRLLFMPNTWQLTAEGEETLRVIAAEIKAYDSQAVLDIEGHTDSLMGDPNNPMQKHEVSSVKTKIIMDFFVNALLWDASQIGTSSFGRIQPIADNGTPEGRARNNRIEIVLRNERQ